MISEPVAFILLGILGFIVYGIIGPVLIYNVIKFNRIALNNSPSIKKRYPFITRIGGYTTLVAILIDRPASMISYTCQFVISNKECVYISNGIQLISWPIGYTFSFILWLLRIWLVYYNINLVKHTSNKIWQSYINNNINNIHNNNYFIRNKQYYGNINWLWNKILKPLLIIIFIIMVIEWIYIEYFNKDVKNLALLIQGIFMITMLIFGTFIFICICLYFLYKFMFLYIYYII